MRFKIVTALACLIAINTYAQTPVVTTTTETKPATTFTVDVKNLKFNGDMRYRFDHADVEDNDNTYTDQKLRARLGVQAQLWDAKFDFRVSMGPGRTSTNVTLGSNSNASGNYALGVDRASFALGSETLVATFGRMGNPFVLVGSTDLVWDSDLNFDGISFKWIPAMESLNTTVSLSRFVIVTEGDTNSVNLNTLQVAVKKDFDDQHILATAGYHFYENLGGNAGLANGGTSGNPFTSGTDDDFYTDDFSIIDIGLEYGFKVGAQSLALYGNFIQNTEASNDDIGYLAGVRVNKLKKKDDWTVYYDFRELEASSTVGAFTDGESFQGGTDGNSHRLGFGYQVGESWYVAATALKGKNGLDNGIDVNRYLVDIGASF